MKIKHVLLKCENSSVLFLSSCSISKRHSNYSLIAARRRHIDIHRKWEHEIMFVLGNSAAMETGWCNCSKQYAVSNARAHYCICTFYRLSNKPPLSSFFSFFAFLFSPKLPAFGCAVRRFLRSRISDPDNLMNVIQTFKSFFSPPFVNIQLPADIYLCLSSVFVTASLLPGSSGFLFILCAAIYFNWLDKVNGLTNVCIGEILWARFCLWRSLEFCLVLSGAGASPDFDLGSSAAGCWRRDTEDGRTLLNSGLFVSRCWSHSA